MRFLSWKKHYPANTLIFFSIGFLRSDLFRIITVVFLTFGNEDIGYLSSGEELCQCNTHLMQVLDTTYLSRRNSDDGGGTRGGGEGGGMLLVKGVQL